MKPIEFMGAYLTITAKGRIANVTGSVRSNTAPQKKARLRLAKAAYGSYGQPQDVLKMNVASQCAGVGSNGGLSPDARRDLNHRMAGVRIQAMEASAGGYGQSRNLPTGNFGF
jgi:hypothetical protein